MFFNLSNRQHQPLTGLLALACLLIFGFSPAQSAESDKPNFLLFIADDMAWDDCGAYGHPKIQTPNLDQLAKQGQTFQNGFLTCSSCSPSRCSIITGRYPHATGAEELHRPLPVEQNTFIDELRKAGYYTAILGKFHLGNKNAKRFDIVVGGFNKDKWVKTLADRPKDKPFCFWAAFSDPHRGYKEGIIPKPHKAEDIVIPPYLPDNAATRHDLGLYYDEITRLDDVVGAMLKELDTQNVADNTVVIFISDNGRPFPRCKTTLYDSGIKTPFIVRFPKMVKSGTKPLGLVSTVDIAPTFLELAGVEIPKTFQGKSFVKIMKDPNAKTRDYIYGDHDWHDFDDLQRAVRDKQFKYIKTYYTDKPQTPPADAVGGETFQSMRKLRDEGKLNRHQLRIFIVPRPAEELYDTQQDPHELHNLINDPAYAKVAERLRAGCEKSQEETEDTPSKGTQRRPDEFSRETGKRVREKLNVD